MSEVHRRALLGILIRLFRHSRRGMSYGQYLRLRRYAHAEFAPPRKERP